MAFTILRRCFCHTRMLRMLRMHEWYEMIHTMKFSFGLFLLVPQLLQILLLSFCSEVFSIFCGFFFHSLQIRSSLDRAGKISSDSRRLLHPAAFLGFHRSLLPIPVSCAVTAVQKAAFATNSYSSISIFFLASLHKRISSGDRV